ncbi:recombinase family protein [Geomonas subterranea]|uniref:Recombinase family protein n=1 Tax=Geomonas subterranea TaxID=2847989 RepID=A0ABX8LB16_9BACT|nr:recombinase family protein [Geomonas subterranea]QXE89193.1 recombinase family protein [Geomonas subterranea]QXM11700.1 recombinase family protein [Geomonas subterranea]
MNGQRLGYIRVSTISQNTDRQLDGVELDERFIDKVSGKDTNRPELVRLLGHARRGDHIVVHALDRLARNLDDLRKIVKTLTAKGVTIEFRKENLIFSGDDSPMSTLLLSVMGAFAEFERSLIKERQLEGIAIAKQKGKFRGRQRTMTDDRIAEIKRRVETGEKKAVIARDLGISRETLYQYLRTA